MLVRRDLEDGEVLAGKITVRFNRLLLLISKINFGEKAKTEDSSSSFACVLRTSSVQGSVTKAIHFRYS